MRGLNFLALALAVSFAAPARAIDCPKGAISSAAADLQDARNALAALAPDQPADTARTELETRVAAFILAYMRCQPENADVDGIAIDLARLGWASTADGAPAAWQLTFKAESFGQGAVGIAATFAVPGGSETVSMRFNHGDDGWAETARRVGSPAPRNDPSR